MTGQGVTLEPVAESIAAARSFALDTAAGVPWMKDRLDDVRLVVSEVVTNAVRAQRSASSPLSIELLCSVTPDVLSLEVVDHGGGFEPPTVPEWPGLELEGGFGLPLIATLADRVTYDRMRDGTRVVVEWRRR